MKQTEHAEINVRIILVSLLEYQLRLANFTKAACVHDWCWCKSLKTRSRLLF